MKTRLKTTLRSLVVIGLFAIVLYQTASTLAATNSVEQCGIYQVTLHGPSNGNPFVDVHLSATFDNGFKQIKVVGFYDGDGIYRIRFIARPTLHGPAHPRRG